MDECLERIRRKAVERGVRLDPPLPEAIVAAFEGRAGVTLPEGYRRFLLEVGDGPRARVGRDIIYGRPVPWPIRGGGPHFKPHNSEVWYQEGPEHQAERRRREGPPYYGLLPLEATLGEEAGDALRPDAPFPLVEAWIWEDEAQPDEGRRQAVYTDGHLYLGTEGCGEDWILILTGPERGRVWDRVDVGAAPCDPPADFLDWYERWLDGRPYWLAVHQTTE